MSRNRSRSTRPAKPLIHTAVSKCKARTAPVVYTYRNGQIDLSVAGYYRTRHTSRANICVDAGRSYGSMGRGSERYCLLGRLAGFLKLFEPPHSGGDRQGEVSTASNSHDPMSQHSIESSPMSDAKHRVFCARNLNVFEAISWRSPVKSF